MIKIIDNIFKWFLMPFHIIIAIMSMIIIGYDFNEFLYSGGLHNITIRYPVNFIISYLSFYLISKIWGVYFSTSKNKEQHLLKYGIMTIALFVISCLIIFYMSILFLKPLNSFYDIAGQIFLGLIIMCSIQRWKRPLFWIKKSFNNTVWIFMGLFMIIIFLSLFINRYYPELTESKNIVQLLPILKKTLL